MSDDMRYERKYRIEGVALQVITQTLRLHPAGLRKIYPDRQINNIYYDTPNLTTFQENVVGIARRKKYRVRWYGYNPVEVANPKLEIKHRNNEVGDKSIFKMPLFEVGDLSELTKEVNVCSGTAAELVPVLLNSYKRSYWGTLDKKFRITIDWDLSYTSMLINQKNFNKHRIKEEGIIVLELKYHKELEAVADRITHALPFRRTKNSKYVNGVEFTHS